MRTISLLLVCLLISLLPDGLVLADKNEYDYDNIALQGSTSQ
ncbi:MAG TPA: hypothetical protein VN364_07365 [Bellilinea sp.]|nr:hypothetical protein [Bellilinea sp.]